MDDWLACLQDAEKTCIREDGKKKVHYKFRDGREMAEEYNMDTQVVTRRAWKITKRFGGAPEWEVEVGDPPIAQLGELDAVGMQEITTGPILSKRITKGCIEWRIRNLPYPLETYSVTIDSEARSIIVRTTNKKYFKKIPMPDFDRLRLPIEQSRIAVSHKFNTLIISYKKPAEMITFEKLLLEEINRIETPKDAPVQCPTS